MTIWLTGKVKSINFWTNTLFTLKINANIDPFIAGQFTKLGLKINGKFIQRAYSYVNAPNNPNLEFYIVSVLNGKLSPYLAMLKTDDNVQISSNPSGFFILKEIPNCETIWMLATGTAIGPYISILEYGKDLERFTNIVLVHAVRYANDLSYLSQMITLKNRYQGKLRIQTIISRENVFGSLTGRIPNLIKKGLLEESVGLPLDKKTSHVMICGNPNMVSDTQNVLQTNNKMSKHLRNKPGNITTENYW